MNKVNTNDEISRVKALMNYGLHTESKNTPYASIEFQKVGSDGKVYGIIREGSKYYIKSAPKKKNLVREDFEYIGGFRNRKDNEYSSFANAEKQFDLKMMSLKESYANGKNIVVESWNPDKKENLSVEATDKMKKEILRERQIMHNAAMISEKKEISADIANTQKNNIKNLKHPATTGPKDSVFTEKATVCPECGNSPCTCGKKGKKKKKVAQECGNMEKVRESAEPLAWHKKGGDAHQNMADTYMDTSKGTEVGSSAPFDAAKGRNIDDDNKAEDTGEATNGVVEGRSMHYHYSNNQNMPKPGTGEGPSDEHNKPFNEDPNSGLDEAITGLGDDVEEGIDAEAGAGAGADAGAPVQEGDDAEEDFGPDVDGEEDYDDGSDEGELDDYDDALDEDEDELDDFDDDEEDEDDTLDDIESDDDELESRVSNIEDLLGKIADKLGVSEFDDDSLYDDDDEDSTDDDDLFGDDETGDGLYDDGGEDDDEELPESYTRNGYQIFESRAFRRAMREDRLNDFGKHPAYQKKVMNLPPNNMQEFPGYYDMNDDSVDNDSPYGEKIGDGAPFSVDPDELEDAIVESIQRNLKKKSNRR